MAEGLLRARGGPAFEVFSAGTHPREVHPLAIKVMRELGIDLGDHHAKGMEAFAAAPPMDLVITVCAEAQEACPVFPNAHAQVHRGFPDPSRVRGSEEQRLAAFRHIRDLIATKINQFLGHSLRPRSSTCTQRPKRRSKWRDASRHRGWQRRGDQRWLAGQGAGRRQRGDHRGGRPLPNYSLCGLPFYLSGEVPDWHALAHRTIGEITEVGVEPCSDLARAAHIELGEHGAVRVSRRMETSVSDIYAAGDGVETWHRLLSCPTYLPLGTTAHKQGRIAGENAVGGTREFAGTLGTQVVKIFDLVVARTGLRDDEARGVGFAPLTVETTSWDHKVYYPGLHKVHIRLTGDRQTGRLLGAQMVGHVNGEVAKRIDIFATALFHGMRVEDLNDLDLSYTPPLSSPWDLVQQSAQEWMRHQIA